MQGMLVKQTRKELEWRQRMTRFAASGEQIKLFCQAEQISEAAFYRWRTKLAAIADAPSATCFIDAGVMPAAPAVQAAAQSAPVGAALEVRLDFGHGMVLHIVRR